MLDVLSVLEKAVDEANALDARARVASMPSEPDEPPAEALEEMLRNARVNADAALNPTMVAPPSDDDGHQTARITDWEADDETKDTIALHPAYDQQTQRTILTARDNGSIDVSTISPPETETQNGVMVHSQMPDRVRTVSTGARPDPTIARDLFDRIITTGRACDRRGGKRGSASVNQVVAALAEDMGDAARHFSDLAARVPKARKLAAMSVAFMTLADPDRAETSAGSRAGRPSFSPLLRAAIDELVGAGRCPSCISRTSAGFLKCSTCGYTPPRRA